MATELRPPENINPDIPASELEQAIERTAKPETNFIVEGEIAGNNETGAVVVTDKQADEFMRPDTKASQLQAKPEQVSAATPPDKVLPPALRAQTLVDLLNSEGNTNLDLYNMTKLINQHRNNKANQTPENN